MKPENIQKAFLWVDEAIKNASSTQIFANVRSNILNQLDKEPLDNSYIRRQRDWGRIANQVVGAEND